MSPVIEPARPSTVLFAWLRLHGAEDEQAVPEPVGDTYSVVCTAALASDVLSRPAKRLDETSPSMGSQPSGLRSRVRTFIRKSAFRRGYGTAPSPFQLGRVTTPSI